MSEQTPIWDTLSEVVQDNLKRQHREGGILTRNLPQAKLQRSIALDPFNDAVKKVQKAIDKIDESLLTATKAAEFRELVKAKKELLAALADAKKARTDKREECPHVTAVNRLQKLVKASQWVRLGQVVDILGPLKHEELTDEDDAAIAEYELTQKQARKLAQLARL